MAYAVLQKDLVAPDLEALKRASRVLPGLQAMDAKLLFQQVYGVLIKGLEYMDANAFHEALAGEGIDAVVLDETHLPTVPIAKIIRQIEFLPAQLNMHDPMGRVYGLPWQDIMFVAAGKVRMQEFRRGKSGFEEPQAFGSGITVESLTEQRPKEQSQYHSLLEIFLIGGILRYSIDAHQFSFPAAGSKYSDNAQQNLAVLLKDLLEFAPHAGLNRGACLLTQNVDELFCYPSKANFHEELVWMLWRIGQARSGPITA
ncbi:MAG TPA: hypothetical protein VGE41_10180 [Verrucomicrobiae bacterium]|jgi:hypothetical protein